MNYARIFPILLTRLRKDLDYDHTTERQLHPHTASLLVIIAAAYWAGGRWGQRQPIGVSALQPNAGAGKDVSAANVAARDAALTDEEAINVASIARFRPPSPTFSPKPPNTISSWIPFRRRCRLRLCDRR